MFLFSRADQSPERCFTYRRCLIKIFVPANHISKTSGLFQELDTEGFHHWWREWEKILLQVGNGEVAFTCRRHRPEGKSVYAPRNLMRLSLRTSKSMWPPYKWVVMCRCSSLLVQLLNTTLRIWWTWTYPCALPYLLERKSRSSQKTWHVIIGFWIHIGYACEQTLGVSSLAWVPLTRSVARKSDRMSVLPPRKTVLDSQWWRLYMSFHVPSPPQSEGNVGVTMRCGTELETFRVHFGMMPKFRVQK